MVSERPMMPAQSVSDLLPGDIGFGPIKGGAGLLVNAGQLLLGEGFRVGRLDIRHVFVVVRSHNPATDAFPVACEAMPRGARLKAFSDGTNTFRPEIEDNRWTRDYAYVRLPEDYPGQAGDAAAIARAMVGTPYSFASYLALAAWRFGIKTARLEKWINRRKPFADVYDSHDPLRSKRPAVALPAEAICSVLADQAWSLAGKRIMHNTAPQAVTPGALAGRLLEMASEEPDAVWTFPGR